MQTITADEARLLILSGELATDAAFEVAGELDLSGETSLVAFPKQIKQVWGLNLAGCTALTTLPDDLQVRRLNLNDCSALTTLPARLNVHSLQAQRSGLTSLPDDITVTYKLDLSECAALESLPPNLKTGSLVVKGCAKLSALPDGLSLYFLDATDCINLETLGENGKVDVGMIVLRNCVKLRALPKWLSPIAQLNIRGCVSLESLPEHMIVKDRIELADSGLKGLPPTSAKTEIRWKDVIINAMIAFEPEKITSQAVMKESNIELRRVMLERMGYEAFFREAQAKQLDRDVDPGGVRRLLRVEFKDTNRWQQDEPVVCLSVICPSTARHYIIRVPPNMKTCHQAAAWVAGFDDPSLYHPMRET